jgi:Ca2+-binding RTX toxin-like protein
VGNSGANTLNGGDGNDSLTGGAGDDILVGGTGSDIMRGGTGNDTYYVNNAGDITTETSTLATEIDKVFSTVTRTLGANLENLTLTGTAAINGIGNALNNTLVGNSGANTLNGGDGNDSLTGGAGDDILLGGAGVDTMVGGTGNDTYYVGNALDVVAELVGQGTDTIVSSVTCTLSGNVEDLTLTGTAAIDGTGNALSNTLAGNSGANTLDGGLGADTMAGGTGNDTYYVDNALDVVTELAVQGMDTINSSVTCTLSANVENLTLTGATAINGTGNAMNNILTGNNGINTLNGGDGNDILDGGM